MSAIELTLGILIMIVSVLIVVVVLLQEGHQQGLSGAIAGGVETFFGKNKGRTYEQKLVRITGVLAIIFFVLTLATPIISMLISK